MITPRTLVSAGALTLMGIWALLVAWSPGASVDEMIFAQRFVRVGVGTHAADAAMRAVGVLALMVAVTVPWASGLARRSALLLAALTPVAVACATAGKRWLPAPGGDGVLGASFPSGHVSALLGAGVVCAVCAPRVAGPLSAASVLIMSVLVVATGWHRPSDVLGAAALVLVLSALTSAAARGARAGGHPWVPVCGALLLLAGMLVAVGALALGMVMDPGVRYSPHALGVLGILAPAAGALGALWASAGVWRRALTSAQ